ncbi:MAG: Transcriptional regulator, IclR family [Candidatus Carbobacillus altaicus]|uniref:Glycerol operon regulatory protein n=1 Tax=Candidatus Carbonibacillus altaicus TaxID=2163959 RepID=A0A2R6Y3T4_9BACL|nr:MAG: Transcriptional regulator, IclR family [Candidatus Carbobacillus altaicus]
MTEKVSHESIEPAVKSLGRALRLAEVLSHYAEGATLKELSAELGLPKSTVHRLLQAFRELGYVEQDAVSGRYRLSVKWLGISLRILEHIDLRKIARETLMALAHMSGEVIHLVVLNAGEVVYIDKVEGKETIRMHSRIGHRAPVHCTAVGKSILAHLPEEDVRTILAEHGLPAHTPQTITDPGTLLKHLRQVRERGVAYDLEENEPDITCVAAPIFDHSGHVVAALSISGPTHRMKPRLESLSEHVKKAGDTISRRLGYGMNT